jgi:hypothetical protein
MLMACSQTTAGEEQTNNSCPSTPIKLTGSVKQGGTCSVYTECAPVCCSCPIGGGTYLASECTDGTCTDMQTACKNEISTTVCPQTQR